jgi:hypothetical protein
MIIELMQNVAVADYGDAPSFIATDCSRIFFMSPHLVRVTHVRADVRHDGTPELRVSGYVDWDIARLRAVHAMLSDVMARVVAAPVACLGYPGGRPAQ